MKTRKRLASSRSELEYRKVARRMRTAIQIADAMEKHGISKKQLADMMGRSPSEITKWLSGDQNFTLDTLTELSYYLKEKITGESSVDKNTFVSVVYSSLEETVIPDGRMSSRISVRPKWSRPEPMTLYAYN
jgi:transcriptional regulator with XRE-family HTH domain